VRFLEAPIVVVLAIAWTLGALEHRELILIPGVASQKPNYPKSEFHNFEMIRNLELTLSR
jgi:hypothetical protein